MKKKSLITLIVILALVVVILVWWQAHYGFKTAMAPANRGNAASSTNVSKRQPVPQTGVDPSQLPKDFPSNIPLESGATVTQNFNAVNANGNFQASREFISAKSMAQNFALYQTALKNSGWTITNAVNDSTDNQYIIFASQGNNSLNIRIYTLNSQVRVSISNETKP